MSKSQNFCKNEISLAILDICHVDTVSVADSQDFTNNLANEIIKKFLFILPEDYSVSRHSASNYYVSTDSKSNFSDFADTVINASKNIGCSPFKVMGKEVSVDSALGIAQSCAIQAVKKASIALRHAKDKNLSHFIYDDYQEMATQVKPEFCSKHFLEMQESFNMDGVFPIFQPIYDYKEKKIKKYECLGRVKVKGKVLSPFQFFPIIKDTPLLAIFTKEIFKKSLDAFRNTNYNFSVNLSMSDITNLEIVEFINSELRDYPNSDKVVFELVEDNDFYLSKEEITTFIKKVKLFGCKISLDDFGYGYANFNVLTQFEFDYIKIDGSLIKKLDDKYCLDVVESIITLAKKWNLKTVVEQVENEEIFEKVKKLDCDLLQGYYIGKPSNFIAKEIADA